MNPAPSPATGARRLLDRYHQGLRALVTFLGMIAGAGLMAMVLVTSLDVVLRVFRISLKGAYDITTIAGALTVAAALPYTTAIKGHVAIEVQDVASAGPPGKGAPSYRSRIRRMGRRSF